MPELCINSISFWYVGVLVDLVFRSFFSCTASYILVLLCAVCITINIIFIVWYIPRYCLRHCCLFHYCFNQYFCSIIVCNNIVCTIIVCTIIVCSIIVLTIVCTIIVCTIIVCPMFIVWIICTDHIQTYETFYSQKL